MDYNLEKLAFSVLEIATKAGKEILKYYQSEQNLNIEYKEDKSPLTIADKAAHDVIFQSLSELTPDIKIISEEGDLQSISQEADLDCYWCVDPLDGSKEFIAQNGEFSVNIGLIINGKPVLGVIKAPVLDIGYIAWENGGCFEINQAGDKQQLHCQQPINLPLRVIISRRHGLSKIKTWLEPLGKLECINLGSALKYAKLAKGEADLFLRGSETSFWDNAAGQCIVEQAGGVVLTVNKQPNLYPVEDNFISPPLIVLGDAEFSLPEYTIQ